MAAAKTRARSARSSAPPRPIARVACFPLVKEHPPAPARSWRAELTEAQALESQPGARLRGAHSEQGSPTAGVRAVRTALSPSRAPGSSRFAPQAALLTPEAFPKTAALRRPCRRCARRRSRPRPRPEAERPQPPQPFPSCSRAASPARRLRSQPFDLIPCRFRLPARAPHRRCSSLLSARSKEIRPQSECRRSVEVPALLGNGCAQDGGLCTRMWRSGGAASIGTDSRNRIDPTPPKSLAPH